MSLGAMAVQTAAAQTKFVAVSQEAILSPYLTAKSLPKTLSIDAFSEAEIATIRQQIYESIKDNVDRKVDGVNGCMQWFLMRTQSAQAWHAFGFASEGASVVKLNGAWRRTDFNYQVVPEVIDRSNSMLRGRGKFPSSGGSIITVFQPKQSHMQLLSDYKEDDKISGKLLRNEFEPDARYLWLLATDDLVIQSLNVPCSYLKAQCRRYHFTVNRPAQWWGRAPANNAYGGFTETISVSPELKTEVIVEDMCPFTRFGIVEGSINTRTRSAEAGVKAYGIPNNASLKAALRPYINESKR